MPSESKNELFKKQLAESRKRFDANNISGRVKGDIVRKGYNPVTFDTTQVNVSNTDEELRIYAVQPGGDAYNEVTITLHRNKDAPSGKYRIVTAPIAGPYATLKYILGGFEWQGSADGGELTIQKNPGGTINGRVEFTTSGPSDTGDLIFDI